MPIVNIKLIEGVYSQDQKQEMIRREDMNPGFRRDPVEFHNLPPVQSCRMDCINPAIRS